MTFFNHEIRIGWTMRKPGLALIVVFISISAMAGDSLQVYQCQKCRICVKKDSRPSSYSCSAGGSHNWNLLGRFGSQIFLCSKCQLLISTRQRPSSYGCEAGGSHNWNLLGTKVTRNYQCKKCRILIRTESRPSSYNCRCGGSHNWQEL